MVGEKRALTRLLKASEILLESPQEVQTRGTYQCEDGKVCAMGLLLTYCGWKGYYKNGQFLTDKSHKNYLKAIDKLREYLGINAEIHNEIIELNDKKHYTLADIGEWLSERGL